MKPSNLAYFVAPLRLSSLLLLMAGVCPAQLRLPELSSLSPDVQINVVPGEAQTHLERASALLSEGEFVEATETLMSLADEYGDRLIAMPSTSGGDFQRYVPLRRYIHWRLATLPKEQRGALEIYRQRVDGLAGQWYESARANRDVDLLNRVVEQFFPSTVGDDALWTLGELALDSGHYNAARRYWESLHPALRAGFTLEDKSWRLGVPVWMVAEHAARSATWDQVGERLEETVATIPWLAYPDTDKPLAGIRARLILVSILEGATQRAQYELELLRRTAPQAAGVLAGRQVNYVDALSALLGESDLWPAERLPADWVTFAGSFDRQRVVPKIVEIYPQPIWRHEIQSRYDAELFDLEVERDFGVPDTRAGEPVAGRLVSVPIVYHDTVFVSDGDRIRAFSVPTGAARIARGGGRRSLSVGNPTAGTPGVQRPLGHAAIHVVGCQPVRVYAVGLAAHDPGGSELEQPKDDAGLSGRD